MVTGKVAIVWLQTPRGVWKARRRKNVRERKQRRRGLTSGRDNLLLPNLHLRDLADTAPSRRESDPPVAEETVEKGEFLARENSPTDADLAKVVEVHDSSPDEEEESDDEEELPLLDPVQTGEPPQEQEKEEQEKEEESVSADALHPEASLPPAPIVEDPSALKEPSA
ncbi:hypothetical protein Bca101_056532 [Brassica carinata]